MTKTATRLFLSLVLGLLSITSYSQCGVFDRIEENFSTTSGTTPPDCWTTLPSNNIFLFDNGRATFYGTDRIFILPNTSDVTGTLSFSATHLSSFTFGGLNFMVGVYTGSGFQQVGQAAYGVPGWKSHTFDFSGYTGAPGNIAIKTTSNSFNSRLALDNIVYQTQCLNSDSAIAIANDITLSLDVSGTMLLNPSQVDGGSYKSCLAPITNLSIDKQVFTCADLGENMVVLTANDDNGHTSTDTCIVNVVPSIGLSDEFTWYGLRLDSSGMLVLNESNALKPNTTSQCSEIAWSFSPDTVDCSYAGSAHFIDLIAVYGDDTTTLRRTLQVHDLIAPTAIANDLTVMIDSLTGQAQLSAIAADAGSFDGCGIDTMYLSQDVFTCTEVGVNQVTLSVKDDRGNIGTDTLLVTVQSFVPTFNSAIANGDICFDGQTGQSSTVTVDESMNGVSYFLRSNLDSSIVDGPVLGTGVALDLETDTVMSNSEYHVYAQIEDQGRALWLPGNNDHLLVNTPGGLDYSQGYTFSAWVKASWINSGNFFEPIFYAGGASGSDIEMYVTSTTSNLSIVHNRGNGGTNDWSQAGLLPTDAEYFHLAVTFDGSILYIYLNGEVLHGEAFTAPTKSSGSELTFGYLKNGAFPGGQYFNGYLDDIRLYTSARSQSEIQSDMNRCLQGNEDDLILYFPLDDATGTITFDLANNTPAQIIAGSGLAAELNLDNAISCDFTCAQWGGVSLGLGDFVNPEIHVRDIILEVADDSTVTISEDELDSATVDNCTDLADLVFSLSQSDFTLADSGSNVITVYVEDLAGNEDSVEVEVEVVKTSVTSVDSKELAMGIAIYPNPSEGDVTLDLGSHMANKLAVYNIQGIMIMERHNVEGVQGLTLEEKTGVYLVEVEVDGLVLRQRLLIK